MSEDFKNQLAAVLDSSDASSSGRHAADNKSGTTVRAILQKNLQKNPHKRKKNTSSTSIYAQVTSVIEDATGIEVEEQRLDSRISEDLNIDSLSLVDITVRLEERFGIRLEHDALHSANTINDIVTLITTRQAAQKNNQAPKKQTQ